MNRKIGIISVIALLLVMIGASALILNRSGDNGSNGAGIEFDRDAIVKAASTIDYDKYQLDTIIPASDDTGGLAEKIEGSKDAKVIIFEYADYGCSHCAEINTTVNRIVSEHEGEVAVVFRTLVLNFPNSVSSASAATAAGNQGYWQVYKNLLFSNQAEWYYLKGEKRDNYFADLFMTASAGKGDRELFLADMASEATVKRLAFNYGAAEKLGIDATPTFRIGGEKVAQSELESKVEELLK